MLILGVAAIHTALDKKLWLLMLINQYPVLANIADTIIGASLIIFEQNLWSYSQSTGLPDTKL